MSEDDSDIICEDYRVQLNSIPSSTSEIGEETLFPLYHNRPEPDQSSEAGKFSWLVVDNKFCFPQISRTEPNGISTRYVSVKMAERVLEPLMKDLPYEVITNPTVLSAKISGNERRLMFEINKAHCNSFFGKDEYFTDDLLISSEDLGQYYTYLTSCQAMISSKKSDREKKFGFLRINGTSDVPYVVVSGEKFVPLFYFEETGRGVDSGASTDVSGWDWVYLKFCCKVQGVKESMLSGSSCPSVSEQDLKEMLPVGTTFQEYWPQKDFLNRVSSSRSFKLGGWTRTVLTAGEKYRGRLVAIKEFPVQANSNPPYKAELASIEEKNINCINIKPYAWQEVMVSLPHLVEQIFPGYSDQQLGGLLERKGVTLHRGNSGHKEVIREGLKNQKKNGIFHTDGGGQSWSISHIITGGWWVNPGMGKSKLFFNFFNPSLRSQGWLEKYEELPLVTVKDLLHNLKAVKANLYVYGQFTEKRSMGN